MPLGLLLLVLDLSNLIIPLVLRVQLSVDVFEAAEESLQLVQRPPGIYVLLFVSFFLPLSVDYLKSIIWNSQFFFTITLD